MCKNVEYLCAALIDIEMDENPFREPDKMYRIILRKIISNINFNNILFEFIL